MTTEYTEVPTSLNDEKHEGKEKILSKFFWRQLLVSSTAWTSYFALGVIIGTPTVFIPQVRREANSTAAVSDEMVTWLSSAFSYSSLPWCIILPLMTDYFGRKKTTIFVSINQVMVSIAYFFSVTPTHLLFTDILNGITNASTLNLCIVSITEFTSPSNRGLMLTIKSATTFWSIWIANAIGTFAPWKYISIGCFINAFYSLATSFVLPESPSWLAVQGRYEECRRSHRWLRGCDKQSEQELELLISTQMDMKEAEKQRDSKKFYRIILEREFYHPIFLSTVMVFMYQSSGKMVVTLYAIDIIKKMTSSESTAYKGMLILDGASVMAMYLGCLLSKYFKRRTLLLFFGFSAVVFLLLMSLYLYLVHLSYVSQNKYISLVILVGFSISIATGPLVLMTSIYGELIPLRYKREAIIVFAFIFLSIQAILLKNSLRILKYLGTHGMFLFYGINVSICLIILYRYLPETKDKTLQEIEEYFKNKSSS